MNTIKKSKIDRWFIVKDSNSKPVCCGKLGIGQIISTGQPFLIVYKTKKGFLKIVKKLNLEFND